LPARNCLGKKIENYSSFKKLANVDFDKAGRSEQITTDPNKFYIQTNGWGRPKELINKGKYEID